jgi:hypothetical protein
VEVGAGSGMDDWIGVGMNPHAVCVAPAAAAARLHQLHITSCDSGPAWYCYAAIGLLGASLMACTYTTQLPTAKVSIWMLYGKMLQYVTWKWERAAG